MKDAKEITGGLAIIKRLPSSVNGNPRYLLRVGGVECRTAPDSGLAYGITNFDGKQVVATIGTYRGLVTVADVRKAEG